MISQQTQRPQGNPKNPDATTLRQKQQIQRNLDATTLRQQQQTQRNPENQRETINNQEIQRPREKHHQQESRNPPKDPKININKPVAITWSLHHCLVTAWV